MIFDIECFSNFFSIILKDDDKIYKYVLFNDTELEIKRTELIKLIKNQTLIGFNNKNYDNLILDYFIENDDITNSELKILNDNIIGGDKIHILRKRFLRESSIYDSIDLYERNPILKSSLKVYEHYKRLNNISETPISFDDLVQQKDVELILQYNIDDVLATEMLYFEVKPLLDSLDDLGNQYNVSQDLKSLSSGQIVDRFFEESVKPEKTPDTLIIDLKQNIDFIVKDELVKSHLEKINKYPVKSYDFHTIKQEVLKKVNTISTDIEEECETSFEAKILNSIIRFGIGGLHSEIEPLDLKSTEEYIIIDCDVNGMYPNVIVKQQITPFYYSNQNKIDFLRIYREIITKRNTLKSEGSTLEESYKLILNTLTGKFKEIFSVLYDPSCHVKTCIYSQYFLWSVLEQLEPYIDTICQVNTDGFSLYIKKENLVNIQNILNSTPEIKWKIKEFKRFISKDCNNYIALTNDDEIKTKGGIFNLGTFSVPQIIKLSLVDKLLFDKDVETNIRNCQDMYDFLYFSKPSKVNITINDEQFQGKVVRFFKSKTGYTIKSNGKQIANAENVIIQNLIEQERLSEIDYQYYINETEKWITEIKGNQHDEVVNLFAEYNIRLCGKTPVKPNEDGIILYKGNANKGDHLYSYETVGINMIDYPELMYIDIDHIADEHRIMIDLCAKSDTIYSTSNLHTDSYRFFFKNNSDIVGHYVWYNDKDETSLEIWNQVKNKVSISGVKQKNQSGEILERYIVLGTELKEITPEIIDWVKQNPPKKVLGIDKQSVRRNNVKEYDQTNNMKKLLFLMADKNNKILKKGNLGYAIFYKKPPVWFNFTGEWRDTTLGIFANLQSEKFDIFIKSWKNSFDKEECNKLKEKLQPLIDQINQESLRTELIEAQVISEVEEENNVKYKQFDWKNSTAAESKKFREALGKASSEVALPYLVQPFSWDEEVEELPKYLFYPLFRERQLSMIFGFTGGGKSIIAMEIANMIAKGFSDWKIFKVETEPQKVLYIDFELGPEGLKTRYKKNKFHKNLTFLPMSVSEWNSYVGFDNKQGNRLDRAIEVLERFSVEHNSKVLFIDNFSNICDINESAADAARFIADLYGRMKALDLTVVFVGHTPKVDTSAPLHLNQLKGSSTLSQNIENIIGFKRGKGKDLSYLRQLKFRNTEQLFDEDEVPVFKLDKNGKFGWDLLLENFDSEENMLPDKKDNRSKYTEDFKKEVVEYKKNHTIEETTEYYSIASATLYKWKKLFDAE